MNHEIAILLPDVVILDTITGPRLKFDSLANWPFDAGPILLWYDKRDTPGWGRSAWMARIGGGIVEG